MERTNKRGHREVYFPSEHLKFRELRERIEDDYLNKYRVIPRSPHPVEFHVSKLRHDTNLSGFQAILSDGGFKEPKDGNSSTKGLVWFSLAVSDINIADAEQRFLTYRGYHRTGNKPFLHKFTSSPAFRKSSRLGNFRFTFPIKGLLASYSTQFCGGNEPQIRIYETVLYQQEVMYAIIVHSPDNQREFKECPLLRDSPNGVCTIQDEVIVWRPEGMSKTHAFRLKPQNAAFCTRIAKKKRKFYRWDHVAIAFHVPQDNIFQFDRESLVAHLSLCQGMKPKLNTEKFVKCQFEAISAQESDCTVTNSKKFHLL